MLAKQVLDYFRNTAIGRNLDINELINVGWYSQARYWEDISKHILDTKREMIKWVHKEYEKQIPQFSCKNHKIVKVF